MFNRIFKGYYLSKYFLLIPFLAIFISVFLSIAFKDSYSSYFYGYLAFLFLLYFLFFRYTSGKRDKMKQRESFLKALFNKTYDAMMLVDCKSELVMDCNNAAVKLFDAVDVNEIIGAERDNFIMMTPSEKEQCMNVLERDKIHRTEVNFITKKGKYFIGETELIMLCINNMQSCIIKIKDITKQKETEKKAGESYERWNNFMNSASDVFALYDENLNLVEVNETGMKTMGLSDKNKLIGQNMMQLFPGIAKTDRFEKYAEVLRTGKSTVIEDFKMEYPNGETYLVVMAFKVGKGLGIIARDVSEKKIAEKKLVESEQNYRQLVELSPDGILIIKLNRVVFANQAALRMFGVTSQEEIKDIYDFIVPEHHSMATERWKMAREGSEVPFSEIKFKKGDGTIIEAEAKPNLISYLGKPAMQIAVHDLTQLKLFTKERVRAELAEEMNRHLQTEIKLKTKIEKQLVEYHQFIDSIVENIPNMLFIKDAKSLRFVKFNRAGEELLGLTEEELLGKNDYDFFPKEQADFFTAKDKKTLSEKKMEDIPEEPISTKFHGKRILHTKKIPILDKNGEAAYLLGISEDITEKKLAEELIIKSLQEKEILLKEVHHRVKNNMQVISSILNLQSAYTQDKNVLEILKESQNRIKTMALIHESLYQINDFSKINFSEYLINLVKNLVYSYQVSHASTLLETDIEENVVISLDKAIPSGLIINELISNCFKHAFNLSRPRKNIIRLQLRKEQEIKMQVKDNGVGIAENIDIYNTKTLGLQLVSTLTDQIGGKVELSRKGGTTISVTFSPY